MTFLTHMQFHGLKTKIPALLEFMLRSLFLIFLLLLHVYTAVMSFKILFPFGLWVFEPDWLLDHSQLV